MADPILFARIVISDHVERSKSVFSLVGISRSKGIAGASLKYVYYRFKIAADPA